MVVCRINYFAFHVHVDKYVFIHVQLQLAMHLYDSVLLEKKLLSVISPILYWLSFVA